MNDNTTYRLNIYNYGRIILRRSQANVNDLPLSFVNGLNSRFEIRNINHIVEELVQEPDLESVNTVDPENSV